MKRQLITFLCAMLTAFASAKHVVFTSSQLDSIASQWGSHPISSDYVKVAEAVKGFADPTQRSATYVITYHELSIEEQVALEQDVLSWAYDNYYTLAKNIESHSHGVYFNFRQVVYCGRTGMTKNHTQAFRTYVQIKFFPGEIAINIQLTEPQMAVGYNASLQEYDLRSHFPYVKEGKADAIYALAFRNYEYHLAYPPLSLYRYLQTRHFEY